MVLNTIQVLRRLILSDKNSGGLSPLEYAAKYSGYRYMTMLMEEEGLMRKTVAFLCKNNFWMRSNKFDQSLAPVNKYSPGKVHVHWTILN